ncbi:MAG: hypothetical protein IPJ76_05450 [Flavobacteriales bacterium]|nr:MAG: hypothetical protein IPJ76_05450 [Flavobacteriales bacterium]
MLLAPTLHAQSPAWLIGNEVLVQPTSGAPQLSLLELPEPNDPNEDPDLQYQGQLAEYSQFVEMDDLGRILFFIIDGRLYDKDGYLMADVNGGGATAELFRGITEVVVYPVPGRCGLWYIFSSESGTLLAPYDLEYSVLDLTIDNPLFTDPARRGTLLDISDAELIGFNPLSNWAPNLPNGFSLNPAPYTTIPIDPWQGTTGTIHFDAVYNAVAERHFLFASTGWHYAIFEITSNDLVHIRTGTVSSGQVNYGLRSAKGEVEVVSVGSEIRFAFTNYHADGNDRFFSVNYWRINALDADLWPFLGAGTYLVFTDSQGPDPLDVNGDPILEMRIAGLEFSPNGEYLYWWMPNYTNGPTSLGYIDLDNNTLNDLVTTAPEFFDSELELGMAPGGITPALYVCGKDALGNALLGALIDPDDPVNAVWDDDVYALNEVCISGEMNGGDLYYLLNAQPGGNPPPAMSDVSCCATRFDLTAFNGSEAPSGSTTWTAAANPFGTSNTVRMAGNLMVPDGASLTIQGMRFEFGTGAGIIVQPGGYLYCNGCTLTNACDERWRGVEVRGNSNLSQLPYSNQGRFRTQNAVVENAEVGALAATRNGLGGYTSSGYRGIIHSASTQWLNNIIDVQILGPTGAVPAPPNTQNRFQDCDFGTNDNWPDAEVPYAHANLRWCGRVLFQNCRFWNIISSTTSSGIERGFGILSNSWGAPRVLGNGNSSQSYFDGLWCGVSVGRHRPYWVRDMHFRNTVYGLADLGPFQGEVTGNVFEVPEWQPGTPSPIGLLLFQTYGYVVEDNLFDGGTPNSNLGIVFLGTAEMNNRIYNNEFMNLTLGTTVWGDHCDEATDPEIGLDILCGDYTANKVDYALGPNARISGNQGVFGVATALAGNRFFNSPSCTVDWDMAFDPAIDPDCYFFYHRHDDPDCVVECPNIDYMQENVPFNGLLLDKPVHCADGFAAVGGIVINSEVAARKNAKAALVSTLAQYNETVDMGETPDVMEALTQETPWLESHALRDILFAHHPLSEEVLEAVIERGEPMDGWHITQVFIQNAPVQQNIVERLPNSGLVSTYQMALIDDAQANGPGSMKDVLEREINELNTEHFMAATNCMRYWAADTVTAGAMDSLQAVLDDGLGRGNRIALVHHALAASDHGAVNDLLSEEWAQEEAYADLITYAGYMEGTNHGTTMGSTEIDALETLAYTGLSGAAQAWDVLLEADHWRELPVLELPNDWKAYRPRVRERVVERDVPQLQAQPNPAVEDVVLSYSTGTQADALVVYGGMGQVVGQFALTDKSGVVELDLHGWGSGLYLGALLREGVPVAEVKFTVAKTN